MNVLIEEFMFLLVNDIIDQMFKPDQSKSPEICDHPAQNLDSKALSPIPKSPPKLAPIANSRCDPQPPVKRRRLGVSSGAHEQIVQLRYKQLGRFWVLF